MQRKRCLLDTVGHGGLLQLTPEEKVERPIHAVTAIFRKREGDRAQLDAGPYVAPARENSWPTSAAERPKQLGGFLESEQEGILPRAIQGQTCIKTDFH